MTGQGAGFANRRRAQSMVEFAMVFPLFLFALMALFDGARMLASFVSLTNGAREMARTLAVPTNTDANAIDAFNNHVIYFGAPSSTDTVTVAVTKNSCGTNNCPTTTATCTPALPLRLASCGGSLPTRTLGDDGYVDVTVTAGFQFTPFYEALLQQMQHLSGSAPTFTITTRTRTYIE